MAQAIVDPAELRQFALNLKKFTGELQDRMGGLMGQLAGLGTTWRDQENQKFVEEFRATRPRHGPLHRARQPTYPVPAAESRTSGGVFAAAVTRQGEGSRESDSRHGS